MSTDQGTITVRHVADRRRYELVDTDTDAVIGTAHYLPFEAPSGSQRIFFHTVVDEAYEGKGLGGRLVTTALDDTIAAGFAVVPVCPYVSALLRRHPELAVHAAEVTAEHRAALAER